MKITVKQKDNTTITFGELNSSKWFYDADGDLCVKVDLLDNNCVAFRGQEVFSYEVEDGVVVQPVEVEIVVDREFSGE